MRSLSVLAVLFVVACKSGGRDPAKIIAKYKPDVLARAADFAAITKMLDGQALKDPAPISPPAVFWGDDKHPRNALVIAAGELQNDWWHGDGTNKPEMTFGQFIMWRDSIDIVNSGKPGDHTPQYLEEQLREFANIRYLLVLVTTDFTMPKMGKNSNYFEGGEFSRGHYAANALLFDVPAHKYLGGWTVEGESSVNVTAEATGPLKDALMTDLSRKVSRAIDTSIAEKLPGALPPDGH